MKRWIRMAASLYPGGWRTHYGPEFDALLEDASLRWSDVADVLQGAMIMQMTTWTSYWKMALVMGALGAILLGGLSFAIPNRYRATAALVTKASMQDLVKANMKILGRDNLMALIQNPRLDLYPKQRQRETVQDIAETELRKNLHVIPYQSSQIAFQAFRIVFDYPDPYKAKAVVDEVSSEFFAQVPVVSELEHPILPTRPFYPLRSSFFLLGAFGGMLLGLLAVKIARSTRYAVVTMSFPKETKQFIDSRIAAGEYRDATEYVRELIRADRERHP